MKKLMIAAFAIAFAAVSQAASVEWSAEGISTYVQGANIASVWAFESTKLTQDAFLQLYVAGDTSWQTTGVEGDFDGGEAAGEITGYGNSAATSNWLAILDDAGNVLVSNIETDMTGANGQSALPGFDLTEASSAGIFNAADGFSQAGWYQAVPEPTSGLLMLLGMGVLALRRRRA